MPKLLDVATEISTEPRLVQGWTGAAIVIAQLLSKLAASEEAASVFDT